MSAATEDTIFLSNSAEKHTSSPLFSGRSFIHPCQAQRPVVSKQKVRIESSLRRCNFGIRKIIQNGFYFYADGLIVLVFCALLR